MVRVLIPVTILLALLGLGIVIVFGDPPADSSENQTTIATVPTQPDAAEAELEEATLEQPAQDSIKRTEVEPEAKGPQHEMNPSLLEGGLLITVLDIDNDQALAQAELFVIDSNIVDIKRMRAMVTSGMDMVKVFRYLGETYLTDEQGQVRIPKSVGDLTLAGSTNTHFNFEDHVEIENDAFTLRLSAIDMFLVRVVDSAGNPVENAPVSVRTKRGQNIRDTIAAWTNADGIAEMKLFENLKEFLSRGDNFVALKILTPTPVEAPIELDHLPQHPVELVMPETGEVKIILEGVASDPSLESFLVQLSMREPGDGEGKALSIQHWDHGYDKIMQGCQYNKPTVTFPFVALDQQLRVQVASQRAECTAVFDGVGPDQINRKVVFTITPGNEFPILAGRLFDAQGEIMEDLYLNADVAPLPGRQSSVWDNFAHANEEGRFIVALDKPLHEGSKYGITLTQRATDQQPKQIVRAEFLGISGAGTIDLGDLVLQEAPLLTQGVVVDSNGEPVSKASVYLETAIGTDASNDSIIWNPWLDSYEYSDENGAFELRGLLPEGDYRISANHSDHSRTYFDFELGATDLVLQLLPSMNRKGQILLDPGIDPQELIMTVRHSSADGNGSSTTPIPIQEDGSFQLNDLPPTQGTIRIRASSWGEDLVVFEDIMLQSPETAILLEVIDLRGQLTSFTVTVVDEGGQELDDAKLLRKVTGGMSWGTRQPITIITRETSVDLEVTANGFRSTKLHGVSTDQHVVLTTGIPIAIILDNAPTLPPGFELNARLTFDLPDYEEGSSSNSITAHYGVPLTGEEFLVSKAEEFTLQFSFKAKSTNYFMPGESPVFVVQDQASLQVFHISLDEVGLNFILRRIEAAE